MDDKDIVRMYLERDETAIECTDAKYGSRLKALAQKITEDEQYAEECVNDAYMQAWSLMPPNEPADHLYAFLARIVRNIALNRCREQNALKRSAHICEFSRELEECIKAPDDIERRISDEAFAEVMNSYLAALDEEKRNIFIRRYWYFDSVADISKRFLISQSKVKTTLLRCRRKLREFLEKEGYEL
ncbi:MAG: RNA polymerase sigma factor [Oscillospiraceae bacterium]|nr:RNA polymerase sigma factor [Oscillospiraceae bacterium]